MKVLLLKLNGNNSVSKAVFSIEKNAARDVGRAFASAMVYKSGENEPDQCGSSPGPATNRNCERKEAEDRVNGEHFCSVNEGVFSFLKKSSNLHLLCHAWFTKR